MVLGRPLRRAPGRSATLDRDLLLDLPDDVCRARLFDLASGVTLAVRLSASAFFVALADPDFFAAFFFTAFFFSAAAFAFWGSLCQSLRPLAISSSVRSVFTLFGSFSRISPSKSGFAVASRSLINSHAGLPPC